MSSIVDYSSSEEEEEEEEEDNEDQRLAKKRKTEKPLPPPPNSLFHLYYKDPFLLSKSKNKEENMPITKTSGILAYACSMISKESSIGALTQIVLDINNKIKVSNFHYSEVKLNAFLQRMAKNKRKDEKFPLKHDSWFYRIKKQSDSDVLFSPHFFDEEHDPIKRLQNKDLQLAAINFNLQLDDYNNTILADFERRPMSPYGNYAKFSQVNQFRGLHMSLIPSVIFPENKVKMVDQAVKDINSLMDEINKIRQAGESFLDKSVFSENITNNIWCKSEIELNSRLGLFPNKNFTKLYLALYPKKSNNNVNIFYQSILKEISFFKENMIFINPRYLHISFAEIDLPFTMPHQEYNLLYAEQISDLVEDYNLVLARRGYITKNPVKVPQMSLRIKDKWITLSLKNMKSTSTE